MGVDISTWRARVGMFTPKTSQNSLLIFSAQARSRLSNNDQAPRSIPENSIQSPQTSIRDNRSMLEGHQKLNSTHPEQKGYYVACIHLSYILHVLLLISVLLIESPSELRPPSSYPPVNPDQNETSPVQLSYVQLLIILMCGDVEVNPGPPHKYEERAKILTKFTVPVEDVMYPEYCSNLKVDFTLKSKDPGYLEQMEDIVQTVCAMLNYAGGVITLNPKTASTAGTDKQRDEWVDKIVKQLELVVPREASRCIDIKLKSVCIEIWLRKYWKFITYKLPFYIRKGNETYDGDLSMISGVVDTKPTSVSMVDGIQWNQLNYGDRLSLSEGMNLEFKCYRTCDASSLLAKITNDEIRGEPKLIKTWLAFTNTEGGGDAIIGIKEDTHGAPILEGQKLSAADEGEVRRHFDELMMKGLSGEPRIWPSTPQSGSEWTINFYPLKNCSPNDRRVLIHIRVNQVAGYVLADEPEAYTMTLQGNIRHVPFNEWKECIKPSNKSAPELLKLGPQSKEQDQDDDMDDQMFKQLVNDLKSHRVTLSLQHIKSASWNKDSEDSQDDIVPGVNMDTCVKEVSRSELLMPSSPSTWVPDKTILDRWVTSNHPDMKKCVDAIAQSHSQDTVVMGTKFFGHLFPRLSLQIPQHHAFDFLEIQGDARIGLWIMFDDCSDIVACKKYANSAMRMLKSQLLSYTHLHTGTKDVKLVISAKVWSIADNCIMYMTTEDYTESTVELSVLQKAMAYCLLQEQSHIKNRLGEKYLIALTKDQLSGILHYPYMNIIVFQGPPGSGKSIIAQHLCEHEIKHCNLDEDKILYICPCQPLADFINFQGRCHAQFTKTEELVHTIREALGNGILLIIIDDAHLFLCSKDEWSEILKQFKPRGKGSLERHLAVFLDPKYQNVQADETQNLFDAISAINNAEPYFQAHVHKALSVVIRISRGIFSFIKTNAEGDSTLTCAHDFQGDGVSVTYTLKDFFQGDSDNPAIKLAKEIVGMYNFEENLTYEETDITILVDADGRGNAEQAVQELYRIFNQFYPEAKIQRASNFPVQGIVIEELKSFSGLNTRVCILVLTCKDTSIISNHHYKCFVASRGITKLVFLLHGDTVDSSFRQLKFLEEEQWQKLTKQLLKEIPEKGSSEEWLKKNVPDTECWHETKTLTIVRCVQRIQYKDCWKLVYWVDKHILPAWRQDEQFVKAVIKAVCERTIHSNEIEYKQLRHCLGSLNCLYGAPETLQLQALESVYDHVRTLKKPEKVLQEVLDILRSEGYISRQVMLSWSSNMDQTSVTMLERTLAGSKKDLEEKIQERMRARQEVRGWMRDTTQLGSKWYDSPHYQRVALHALCQLAVTWLGDKCTVDKDLLSDYIQQLFCNTLQKIQLLYAVQCVLYELSNPPGLAESVLEALLSPKPDRTQPIITESHLEEWRKKEHPAYEEGRESMLLALTNLNI